MCMYVVRLTYYYTIPLSSTTTDVIYYTIPTEFRPDTHIYPFEQNILFASAFQLLLLLLPMKQI